MTKAKAQDQTSMVTMRFPKALLEKIDRFMRHFEKVNQGLSISRADAIRMLITQGLEKSETLE